MITDYITNILIQILYLFFLSDCLYYCFLYHLNFFFDSLEPSTFLDMFFKDKDSNNSDYVIFIILLAFLLD